MMMLMTFSTALKQAREEAGLIQTELAKLLGVIFPSINRYENGHHEPTPIVLNVITIFFKKKGIYCAFDSENV